MLDDKTIREGDEVRAFLERRKIENRLEGIRKRSATMLQQRKAQLLEVAKAVKHREMIYFIQAREFVKIGFSGGNVLRRWGAIQTGCPLPTHIAALVPAARAHERSLHAHFKEFRLHGEWFSVAPEIVLWAYKFGLKPVAFELPEGELLRNCTEETYPEGFESGFYLGK